MPGLDPGIHAVAVQQTEKPVAWIAGSDECIFRSREFRRPAHPRSRAPRSSGRTRKRDNDCNRRIT
jgi:hypothetical protein